MNASVLDIREFRDRAVCVVALSGRVDSTNANDVMAKLSELIASGEKAIVVDLGAVLYLTSAAFRALLVATDEAEHAGKKFALCSMGDHVRELFEMGGLLDVFVVHSTREEAIGKLA
jgi:anti-anti-sigma factor